MRKKSVASKKKVANSTASVQPKKRSREIPEETEFRLAQVVSGIGPGRKQSEELQEILEGAPPFVTEKEWTEIKRAGGLPDYARFDINRALRRYWYGLMDRTIKDGMTNKIERVIAKAEALLGELSALYMDGDLAKNGATEAEIEDLDTIERTCVMLTECFATLEKAADRLYKSHGRKSYGPIVELIADLDKILIKNTNSKLSNSTNRMAHGGHSPIDYVWSVCKIAHLSVKRSTISTRLADYITERNRRSSSPD